MQKDTPTQTTAIGVSFLYKIFLVEAMCKINLISFDENNNDQEEITIIPFVDWTNREIVTVILVVGLLFCISVLGYMFKK